MTNIYHVIYEGVEALDFTGPHDVFAMANVISQKEGKEPPFRQMTVAISKEPIKTTGGISIIPDFAFDDVLDHSVDVIVIPGSREIQDIQEDDPMAQWIRSHYSSSKQITSICLGAFPLVVALGKILDGQKITTHHGSISSLQKRIEALGLEVMVVSGIRYVGASNILSSAGVSAGIDAAFYLLSKLEGADLAAKTANLMEYYRTINWALEPA